MPNGGKFRDMAFRTSVLWKQCLTVVATVTNKKEFLLPHEHKTPSMPLTREIYGLPDRAIFAWRELSCCALSAEK